MCSTIRVISAHFSKFSVCIKFLWLGGFGVSNCNLCKWGGFNNINGVFANVRFATSSLYQPGFVNNSYWHSKRRHCVHHVYNHRWRLSANSGGNRVGMSNIRGFSYSNNCRVVGSNRIHFSIWVFDSPINIYWQHLFSPYYPRYIICYINNSEFFSHTDCIERD